MMMNCTETPPTPCLWQAPASTQKTQKEIQAGHSLERAAEGQRRKKESNCTDYLSSALAEHTRGRPPQIPKPHPPQPRFIWFLTGSPTGPVSAPLAL